MRPRGGAGRRDRRFLSHPREKIAVLLGLAVGICVPYFTLGNVQLFPLRGVPVTPLDAWIGFDPRWIWPYLSLALLVPIAPLLAKGFHRRLARSP